MPVYVNKVLKRYDLPYPFKPQYSPYAHVDPNYGATFQYTAPPDISPYLSPKQNTTVQEIIGILLYYARAVDLAIYVAIGTLGSVQTNPT